MKHDTFKRTVCPVLLVVSALMMFSLVTRVNAQVFELRRVYERYETGKIQVGGELLGPTKSQLAQNLRGNIPVDKGINLNGYVSVDLWQLRGGILINDFNGALAPFIFWNPIFGNSFGGDSSRWSASLGWENIFADDQDIDPKKNLQADNSVYSSKNSLSLLFGYWAGPELDSADMYKIYRRAYPTLSNDSFNLFIHNRLTVDTNYWGRGRVDTNNYNRPPYDTNSYIRGVKPPREIEAVPVYYTNRNGLSVALGLGNGKYAGSGKWSRHLNFLYDSAKITASSTLLSSFDGLNPIAVARYRIDDWIIHADWAGDDGNLGVIYRGLRDFDFEGGVKYLEHVVTPQAGDGINKPEFFLGVRYAPPFNAGFTRYEYGDQLYVPDQDLDGDGLIDRIEIMVTHTDPRNPDTDGDGLNDGLEVMTYKTNPLQKDSDGDGLTDGQEVLSPRKTDPLRPDTDGDGLTDGEEVKCDLESLRPGPGRRDR